MSSKRIEDRVVRLFMSKDELADTASYFVCLPTLVKMRDFYPTAQIEIMQVRASMRRLLNEMLRFDLGSTFYDRARLFGQRFRPRPVRQA
jgi:hypothetical protein